MAPPPAARGSPPPPPPPACCSASTAAAATTTAAGTKIKTTTILCATSRTCTCHKEWLRVNSFYAALAFRTKAVGGITHMPGRCISWARSSTHTQTRGDRPSLTLLSPVSRPSRWMACYSYAVCTVGGASRGLRPVQEAVYLFAPRSLAGSSSTTHMI